MRCWHFWRGRHYWYDGKHRTRTHCLWCCDRMAARDARRVMAAFERAANDVTDVTPDEG